MRAVGLVRVLLLLLLMAVSQPTMPLGLATERDPLNYPLRQWAFILGIALFGGFASWWAKVRAGQTAFHNLQALIGELTVSAFVGTIAFLGCEYMNLGPFLTPALVGIAGHMGTKAIVLLEKLAERKVGRALLGDRNEGGGQ